MYQSHLSAPTALFVRGNSAIPTLSLAPSCHLPQHTVLAPPLVLLLCRTQKVVPHPPHVPHLSSDVLTRLVLAVAHVLTECASLFQPACSGLHLVPRLALSRSLGSRPAGSAPPRASARARCITRHRASCSGRSRVHLSALLVRLRTRGSLRRKMYHLAWELAQGRLGRLPPPPPPVPVRLRLRASWWRSR